MSPKYEDMKLVLVSAALVSLAAALHPSPAPGHEELMFARFREQFDKKYQTRSEHERRFSIFRQNLRKYEQHNKSGASWTMGRLT